MRAVASTHSNLSLVCSLDQTGNVHNVEVRRNTAEESNIKHPKLSLDRLNVLTEPIKSSVRHGNAAFVGVCIVR